VVNEVCRVDQPSGPPQRRYWRAQFKDDPVEMAKRYHKRVLLQVGQKARIKRYWRM
jgi:hypothetical protein